MCVESSCFQPKDLLGIVGIHHHQAQPPAAAAAGVYVVVGTYSSTAVQQHIYILSKYMVIQCSMILESGGVCARSSND